MQPAIASQWRFAQRACKLRLVGMRMDSSMSGLGRAVPHPPTAHLHHLVIAIIPRERAVQAEEA